MAKRKRSDLDPNIVGVLALLTYEVGTQEGTFTEPPTPRDLALISEGFRTASMLHLWRPDFMTTVADWYGDDDKRSNEELRRNASAWIQQAKARAAALAGVDGVDHDGGAA